MVGGKTSSDIQCDADAASLKRALEDMSPSFYVSVSRSDGPSIVGGYKWTVSFLDDVTQTHVGNLPEIVAISSLTGGSGYIPTIKVREEHRGTQQEVQMISVISGGDEVHELSSFKLSFWGRGYGKYIGSP